MRKSLAAPLLVVLVLAQETLGYDKCPTIPERLKALTEASHLKDYPKLASCFAPPHDGAGMKSLLEASARYDLTFPKLYEVALHKLKDEDLQLLSTGPELLSPLHVYVAGDLETGEVKPGKPGEPSAAAFSWKVEGVAEPEHGFFYLVLQDGDWRVLLDGPDAWPGDDWPVAGKAGSALAASLEKAAIDVEALAKEFEGENAPTKDAANEKLAAASASIQAGWKALQKARTAALEKAKAKVAAAADAATAADKAAADKAAAEKAAAEKAAAEKAAADKAAEKTKKEAARLAQAKPVAEAPGKTTPPSPEETKTDEAVKDEGIATGTIVVFVILALACAGVVGVLLMRAKGEGARPKRSKGSASTRSKGSTGRKKRPRGPKKSGEDEASAP